jgi:integrase
MATACLPDGWIRKQMGHASMDMLEKIYAKWVEDADKVLDWVIEKTQDGHNGSRLTKFFINKQ